MQYLVGVMQIITRMIAAVLRSNRNARVTHAGQIASRQVEIRIINSGIYRYPRCSNGVANGVKSVCRAHYYILQWALGINVRAYVHPNIQSFTLREITSARIFRTVQMANNHPIGIITSEASSDRDGFRRRDIATHRR